MDLRPELMPPVVGPERLEELSREIERIAGLVEARSADEDEAIRAFNTMTGHDYEACHFAHYWRSRDLEDFAREAARPARPRVADVTKEELVEIVRRVLVADAETDYYLLLLQMNVLHPAVSGLIFHPADALRDASAEEIVEEALAYRPIAL
ncbi:hypothetical protein QFZ82_007119 [Streptomyces sp. V4I23]|uniref:hypothetical protein n=1 Tax=Streptomyces sp. V4I23 TaxID=3042282 RepID=UPI00278BA98D|nr:hypothetical protein [Streptomyces sp. V4I23]MDQ1012634.1 hypothetical protein [Streptomyces sp. V4I23]